MSFIRTKYFFKIKLREKIEKVRNLVIIFLWFWLFILILATFQQYLKPFDAFRRQIFKMSFLRKFYIILMEWNPRCLDYQIIKFSVQLQNIYGLPWYYVWRFDRYPISEKLYIKQNILHTLSIITKNYVV